MNEINMMQYRNLKNCLSKNLITPILGKDYYNHGMDVYTCDELITEDLKYKYDCMYNNLRIYEIILILSICLNILLLIY